MPPLVERLQSYKTLDTNLLQCTVTCSRTLYAYEAPAPIINLIQPKFVFHKFSLTYWFTHKDETAKTTENSLNVIILKINEV